jgi:hypothetical protein
MEEDHPRSSEERGAVKRYLVIANQTLGGEGLMNRIRSAVADGPCSFHLVVPSTPPRDHLTWEEGDARARAQQRLDDVLGRCLAEGIDATGNVGDPSPVLAAVDTLLDEAYDEIIVSTFPPGVSRWLKMSLPDRLERRFRIPVSHVVSTPVADGAPLDSGKAGGEPRRKRRLPDE